VVQHACFIGLVIALAWAVMGTAALRALAFPLGFLLFALPLADRFIPGLQDIAARFAVTMLSASGVPVLLQGHVISIPGATWEVAKACSGINYLMSSLALGYVYAGLTYTTWRNRLLFMVAAALIPLVANGIRVYGTILIAYYGATGIVEGTQHYLFGWIVFAIMMAILLWTCGGWKDGPIKDPRSAGTAVQAFGASANVVMVGTLLVGAAAPIAGLRLLEQPPSAVGGHEVAATVRAPWRLAPDDPYGWKPRFGGTTSEFARTYTSGAHSVRLHAAFYSSGQAAAHLVSGDTFLFQTPWNITDTKHSQPSSIIPALKETLLSSAGVELLVWSWYTVGTASTGSDYRAKVLLARTQLLRQPLTAWHVAVATSGNSGDETASSAVLASFIDRLQLTTDRPDDGIARLQGFR
jgi:EpsI family protein